MNKKHETCPGCNRKKQKASIMCKECYWEIRKTFSKRKPQRGNEKTQRLYSLVKKVYINFRFDKPPQPKTCHICRSNDCEGHKTIPRRCEYSAVKHGRPKGYKTGKAGTTAWDSSISC